MAEIPGVQLICADVLDGLRRLPTASVQLCVTSPPYYALRSYIEDERLDKLLEIGLEPTPAAYVERLVAVFTEVWRVVRPDGCCFVVMGSTYASSTMESEEYVLREDLSPADRAYVFAELARHYAGVSAALPILWGAHAPAEQEVPGVQRCQGSEAGALRAEDV